MPSEKILTAKQAYVAELKEKINAATSGVIVDYKGITVENDTKLRSDLRAEGVEYAVVKNTMLRIAVAGTELEGLSSLLEGTTALALGSEDAIAPAKILDKYATDSKGAFTIKAGFMDGKVMSAAEVQAIASLPGREGLLSMLCSALQGNLRGLAVSLKAVADQKDGEVA